MKYIFSILTLLISLQVWALDVPKLTSPVMDMAGVLSSENKQELSNLIREIWEKEKQVQMSVLIIPSLEGENLEAYSIKVAEQWQLGTQKEDNGLLILIAMNDRKMRIEVGNGIEGIVTDAKSGRMISEMKPYMKKQDVAGALNYVVKSLHELMQANTPEKIAQREAEQKLEEERLAEEAKIAEANRAEQMMKMAEMAVNLLAAFLFLVGLYNFVDYFVLLPKEMKSLTNDKERNNQLIKDKKVEVMAKNEQLEKLKVDKDKYDFVQKQTVYSNLSEHKSKMAAAIKTMKNYLGVK